MNPIKFYSIPAGSRPVQCNGRTCHATMYWTENPATGRRVPIDCNVPGGCEPTDEYDGRGVSHFTTCPDAAVFSKYDRK